VIDAPERRISTAAGRDSAAVVRFTVVVLCLLGTACAYVGCIVVVTGGHIEVLFGLVPWLATTALATIVVVTIWALVGASRERLQNRHQLTAERITELAECISDLEPSERARAKKQLLEQLDVTRAALGQVMELNPAAREALIAGGVAARIERVLVSAKRKWDRVSAAGILGLLGAQTSIESLHRALADHDLDVAYAAAQSLSMYASPEAYSALLSGLTLESLPAARVANLLEAFQCPEARQLIESFAESENARVRYWVAYLLGSLADPRSAPVIERLARDPEEDVRANAAESLASFPDPVLLGRLLADESWVVRSHAAKATGAGGLARLAPRLAELLEDRSWWVRQNAMIALVGFGDAALPHLLWQLHSHDRFARNKAAEALIRNGYAARQIELVAAGEVDEGDDAWQFLLDLGRAEALGTIETAARSASSEEARSRLIDVLAAIETDASDRVVGQLAVAA
jgi:HEAT repeat protein